MRELLLGYLLGALEADEQRRVEERLQRDVELQRELEALSECLAPLAEDCDAYEPPAGLAEKTCELVSCYPAPAAMRRAVRSGGWFVLPRYAGWSAADVVVTAGLFIALACLFFPAIASSRFQAQVVGCQHNLRQLGVALATYSSMNGGYFPHIPTDGKLSVAGAYAPILHESQLLSEHRLILCPATVAPMRHEEFTVPTVHSLERLQGPELVAAQKTLGGNYGYNLGYVSNGEHQAVRDLGRAHFAVMADSPSDQGGKLLSSNHGCRGQNVLFESGRVQHLVQCHLERESFNALERASDGAAEPQTVESGELRLDDFFHSDRGLVEAGLHPNDAVIGASNARPAPWNEWSQ